MLHSKRQSLTDGSILKNDEETCVVLPLYLKAARHRFIFCKGSLDVLCFELLGESSEGEDAGNTGGETRESSSHGLQKIVITVDGRVYKTGVIVVENKRKRANLVLT